MAATAGPINTNTKTVKTRVPDSFNPTAGSGNFSGTGQIFPTGRS